MPTKNKELKREYDRRYWLRKTGKLPQRVILTAEQRFWLRVEKTDTCWLWQGKLNRQGYGTISCNNKDEPVHRFSFVLHGGVVPQGKQIDHLCRVRHCVRPSHLEAVTIKLDPTEGSSLTKVEEILDFVANLFYEMGCNDIQKGRPQREKVGAGLAYQQAISRLIQEAEERGEQNGVAWSVKQIDEMHLADTQNNDQTYKSIKNSLRDRFKAVTGIDPAPRYPIEAELQNPKEENNE